MLKVLSILILTLSLISSPQPVLAHSFGKLYNLPVPFWMYLYGAAASLIISFLVIGYFINEKSKDINYPQVALSNIHFLSLLTNPILVKPLKLLSLFLLFFTMITGFIGVDNSYFNFNMTFFWIIFVLLLTYLTFFIGNIYAFINPWRVMIESIESFLGKNTFSGIYKYPPALLYYPALILYIVFIWIELSGISRPFSLSIMLLLYTVINLIGTLSIGKKSWFEYGEFFGVFLKLVGKISFVEYKKGQIYLRPPFVGLVRNSAQSFSLLLFILFMLSSTAFDGFRETLHWYSFYKRMLPQSLVQLLGNNSSGILQFVGLIIAPLIFLAIYLIFIFLAKIVTNDKKSLKQLMLHFAFPLVPIAFVYNIAHYYTLILSQGQYMIRIISDPFGWGWDIFGTASNTINLSLIDAGITWHFQVAVILVGHIAGVYLSHIIALRVFSTHKKALMSQFPMLALMVLYTLIGLWVLAQPVTGGAL
jgi:hypothetical protein